MTDRLERLLDQMFEAIEDGDIAYAKYLKEKVDMEEAFIEVSEFFDKLRSAMK